MSNPMNRKTKKGVCCFCFGKKKWIKLEKGGEFNNYNNDGTPILYLKEEGRKCDACGFFGKLEYIVPDTHDKYTPAFIGHTYPYAYKKHMPLFLPFSSSGDIESTFYYGVDHGIYLKYGRNYVDNINIYPGSSRNLEFTQDEIREHNLKMRRLAYPKFLHDLPKVHPYNIKCPW